MNDTSMLKNCTTEEELCAERWDWIKLITEYNCPKPCEIKQLTGEIEERVNGFEDGPWSVNFYFTYPLDYQTVLEEKPIYDFLEMVGSVGGSLGICVGISIYDILSMIVDKIFKHEQ